MLKKIRSTLSYYTNIYIKILKIYIKMRLSYRADFIIGFFGMIIKSFSGIITLGVIFTSIPQINGWNYADLLFLYAFSSLSMMLIDTFLPNLWNLHNHIIQGTFVKYCLRPINTMFYYFSEVIEFKSLMQLFISIPLLIYSSNEMGICWNARSIFICCAYVICAVIIIASIYIMAASLGFWISNSISIINFIGQLTRFAQYPLSIFGNVFKFLFSYILPLGFISYYPTLALLGEISLLNLVIGWGLAIVFMILCRWVWNAGVSRYSGTGS